jgi:4-amino-4-deoxy-L-arabinose transferase-like glycosyltransferase
MERLETSPPARGRGPGLILAALGAVPVLLVMASDRQLGFSVPLGVAGCAACSCGVLRAMGMFEERRDRVVARVPLRDLAPRFIELLASSVVLISCLRLAVAGVLPAPRLTAALTITAAFVWLIVTVFRIGQSMGIWGELDDVRPLRKRHGFWLIVLTALAYLPMLGSFSLTDPWETHYGEVAREMLARDDWISLWWAQDGWFFSKPILDFWLQGLGFSLLGVRFLPDQMLAGAEQGLFPQPEWAARMPVFAMTVIGGYLAYKAVALVFGRLSGFLSGIVLMSVPYWYLLAHQTMTDMPYVAPLAGGMALLLLGFQLPPEREVRAYEITWRSRSVRFSAFHLLYGAVLMMVLPQILYLLSRHVTLHLDPLAFSLPHADTFFSGSGSGNCGLPGNEPCRPAAPVHPILQPGLMAVVWAIATVWLLVLNREERRASRLCFQAGWLCVALSAMAKGAPGLVLPVFVTAVYVFATKRWRDLPRIELGTAALLTACLILPWYVQMYARHGSPFLDRLLMHDMYKRAFVHVHDTNVGDDTSFRYYVWQLGYGLFPWTGFAAAGMLWWLRPSDEAREPRADASAFFGLWFVSAFALFTISLTKFHHYVLPAVPPLAMLTGILLGRALEQRSFPAGFRLAPYLGSIAIGTALALIGAAKFFPGSIFGSALLEPDVGGMLIGAALILIGALAAGAGCARYGTAPRGTVADPRSATFAGLGIAAAAALLLSGRDLFSTLDGDVEGQARLLHLFTYNYGRPWPNSLDFSAPLAAFAVVGVVLCIGMASERWRGHFVVALCSLAVLWTGWALNVYLVKAAPHYGQRETILAYYRSRASADEPLVAYQMNWKGENFYTGNRIATFVSTGAKFREWLDEQRAQGVRVVYFVTEHTRLGSLKSELGSPRRFAVLTDKRLNNKFFLARATY